PAPPLLAHGAPCARVRRRSGACGRGLRARRLPRPGASRGLSGRFGLARGNGRRGCRRRAAGLLDADDRRRRAPPLLDPPRGRRPAHARRGRRRPPGHAAGEAGACRAGRRGGAVTSAPDGVERNYPLQRLTTIRTGGPADWFARAGSSERLSALLEWARERSLAVGVVGSGSNLLIADEGFRGLVLKLDDDLATIVPEGRRLLCGGGARLPQASA